MKRLSLVAVATLVVSLCLFRCSRAPERPNIFLVSIDSLRADHLRPCGYEKQTSPFLDSLVSEGVSFKNAIVQANWTLPSHVSLFTSLYPAVHRAQEAADKMSPSLLTMAEMLNASGYETAAFVDGPVMSHEFGFDQGFGLYDDRSDGRRKDKRVIRWLKKNREKPFFLFYHTYDVHYPYAHHPNPRGYADDAELEKLARRVKGGDYHLSDEEFEKLVVAFLTDRKIYTLVDVNNLMHMQDEIYAFTSERWPKMPSYRESVRYLLEAYDACITFFDARLEKLWGEIRNLGLDGNTVFIVTSDHGECFLEHGTIGHPHVLYDEILRVPLVIVYPPLESRGKEVEEQVMSIDILPTALDILNLPLPPHFQGRSLLPLLRGGKPDGKSPAYADALRVRSIRTDEWKYIRGPGEQAEPEKRERPELYDLATDPGEKLNLAGSDTAVLDKLDDRMSAWEKANRERRNELGMSEGPEKAELSEETLNELRALGYL